MKNARNEIQDLRRAMAFFEDQKIARGMEKLSDGVTHSPVFLIRSLLRRLPAYYVSEAASQFGTSCPPRNSARRWRPVMSRGDMKLTPARVASRRISSVLSASGRGSGRLSGVLQSIVERSAVINHPYRMTGNGMILVVDEVIAFKDKLNRDELQAAMEAFIESQVLIPGRWKPIPAGGIHGTFIAMPAVASISSRSGRVQARPSEHARLAVARAGNSMNGFDLSILAVPESPGVSFRRADLFAPKDRDQSVAEGRGDTGDDLGAVVRKPAPCRGVDSSIDRSACDERF